ncbi:uncharacterized protein LOC144360308 [Saccoglossus kowalevskii]
MTSLLLEGLVYQQKQEIERLRNFHRPHGMFGSSRTSTSTSPTPPSINSYQPSSQTNSHDKECINRPCSQCSQCSSALSSPKLTRSNVESQSSPLVSPIRRPRNSRNFTQGSSSNESIPSDSIPRSIPQQNGVVAHKNRTLPVEMVSNLPNTTTTTKRVHPIARCSKEVQCSLVNADQLEKKCQDANNARIQLDRELKIAKDEIQRLKNKLKTLKELQEDRTRICEVRIENEVSSTSHTDDQVNHDHSESEMSVNLPFIPASVNSKTKPPIVPRPQNMGTLALTGPLIGCKCTTCNTLDENGYKRVSLNILMERNSVLNHRKQPIELDDHVVVRGERTGHARYIGHLDNVGTTHVVYVGLQLDAPVGRHDGFLNGKRYFWCHRNHGVFLPMQDIICVLNKKVCTQMSQRPKTGVIRRASEDSMNSSKTVNSNHSNSNGYYHSNSHSHMRKRTKSAPGRKLITADSNQLKVKRENHSSQGSL